MGSDSRSFGLKPSLNRERDDATEGVYVGVLGSVGTGVSGPIGKSGIVGLFTFVVCVWTIFASSSSTKINCTNDVSRHCDPTMSDNLSLCVPTASKYHEV